MPHLKINRKLERLLTTSKPLKVAYGGRGSGKSIGFGDVFTMKMDTEKADVFCLREYQDSISDSVHRVFKSSIEKRLGLDGWDIQNNKIISPNGAQTTYKGASRNPDSIQSAQDYKYSWYEEAHRASQMSIDKLLPTILRTAGAECWFSANPQSSADPFSQRFLVPYLDRLNEQGYYEDDLHLIVKMNWRDNPWWNDEQESLRAWDYENMSRSKYNWIWEGEFNDEVDDALIKAEWFDAAVNAHVKLGITPSGATISAFDPADSGEDAKGFASRKGIYFHDVDEIEVADGNAACDSAITRAIAHNADLFVWDADGMGALLRRQIDAGLSGIKCDMRAYHGGGEVEDKKRVYDGMYATDSGDKAKTNADMFYNKRAQRGVQLAQMFYNTYQAVVEGRYIDPDTLISINPEINLLSKLRAEVCRIPVKDNLTGKIQLMPKQEMKNKHGISSPNMYDAMTMALEVPEVIEPVKINFKGFR